MIQEGPSSNSTTEFGAIVAAILTIIGFEYCYGYYWRRVFVSLQHHYYLSVTRMIVPEHRLVSVGRPGVIMADDGPLFVSEADLVCCFVPIDFAYAVLPSLSSQRCSLAKHLLHCHGLVIEA